MNLLTEASDTIIKSMEELLPRSHTCFSAHPLVNFQADCDLKRQAEFYPGREHSFTSRSLDLRFWLWFQVPHVPFSTLYLVHSNVWTKSRVKTNGLEDLKRRIKCCGKTNERTKYRWWGKGRQHLRYNLEKRVEFGIRILSKTAALPRALWLYLEEMMKEDIVDNPYSYTEIWITWTMTS